MTMLEFLALDDPIIAGIFLILLIFVPLRFNDTIIDFLLSYRSSPVEMIEKSIPDQD